MNQLTTEAFASRQRFLREEIANSITHGSGLLLAVAGAIWLVVAVADGVNVSIQVGCWIYAVTLIGVYAASTLSHVVFAPQKRHFFRSLDQGVIFLFIAGNFTPVAMLLLTTALWWWLLPLMWLAALTGFCSKVFWKHRVESIAVTHYLALGWLPILAAQPIIQGLPEGGLFWSVAGGLCYTAGTIFLMSDEKVPYFHAVWHLLVIAGSTCHFLAVIKFVLPS